MKFTFSVKKWKLRTVKPKFSSAAAGNGYMKSRPCGRIQGVEEAVSMMVVFST
jgi:hypothetical protein